MATPPRFKPCSKKQREIEIVNAAVVLGASKFTAAAEGSSCTVNERVTMGIFDGMELQKGSSGAQPSTDVIASLFGGDN
jgi:hypothetical protein